MKRSINLGQRQIIISVARKKGRPKKTFLREGKAFVLYLRKVATDKRFTGYPVSRVLRRIVETPKMRRIFGLNLAVFTLISGTLTPSISAYQTNQEPEFTTLSQNIIQVTTENTVRQPLETFSVSQGYHLFHRAVDLNENTGAPVYPIMNGRILATKYGHLGYGNYIVIDHGSGFSSLYAHLSRIKVKTGQEVDKNTLIGLVGSTGLSTGSHLHLEVYDHGEPFNPLTILR